MKFLLSATLLFLSSCQLPYLMRSAFDQLVFLNQREPLSKVLADPNLEKEERRKFELASRARDFAINNLHLKETKNYQTFVKLKQKYVTYVVSASPKWELSPYQWSFPIIGKVPYKGYFDEVSAQKLQKELEEEGYDTYLRGVSAFSTLGWFEDPLTSAMLRYDDFDLVNTIIHESVHATIYIKHEADFNERLAVFIGNLGMELFYLHLEGPQSPTLKLAQQESADERLFAQYLTTKIKEMEAWYNTLRPADRSEEIRQKKLQSILDDFSLHILPQLQSGQYKGFIKAKLNNAHLINYKTYFQDLSAFERLYNQNQRDIQKFMSQIKTLESHPHPTEGLKALIQKEHDPDK